jgi:hypothetical protein
MRAFLFPVMLFPCSQFRRTETENSMSKHSESREDRSKRDATPRRRIQRTERFRTLLSLAREGNEDAIGDLWREFQSDFAREGGWYDAD